MRRYRPRDTLSYIARAGAETRANAYHDPYVPPADSAHTGTPPLDWKLGKVARAVVSYEQPAQRIVVELPFPKGV